MSNMLTKALGAALLALGLCSPALAQGPQLSIAASPSPAQVGQTITVDVLIHDIQDLYAFGFSVYFDPAVLQAVSSSEGSFLSSAGPTFGDPGTIDNGAGSISYAAYVLQGAVPAGAGASGDGVLLHLSFTALSVGTSNLGFSNGDPVDDPYFGDTQGNTINVAALPGTAVVIAVPEPESFALLLAGLGLGVGLRAWRRRGALAA